MKTIWLPVFLFCTLGLYAQDDYQKWLEKENNKLSTYISEEDKKFADFLKKEWIKGGLKEAPPLLQKPKPVKLPVYKVPEPETNKNTTPVQKEIKAETKEPIVKIEKPREALQPVAKPVITEAPASLPHTAAFTMLYYNSPIEINNGATYAIGIEKPVSNKTIARYWEEMSKKPFKSVLDEASKYKARLNLNDWGVARWYYQYGKQWLQDKNERNLFTWFMLVKSGYLSRVAYRGDDILLLLATKENLFGLPFFTTAKKKMYVINFEGGTEKNLNDVYIYKEDFPGAIKEISMAVSAPPSITSKTGKRVVTINYQGEKLTFNLPYNTGAEEFYANYPQTDFYLYPNTKISSPAVEDLLGELRKATEKRTERDALNFLLHFVQQATEYKTDDEQFGFEKPMFPEESLYYRYSDCEDRSILFAYLVKNLLRLEVVLLDFPDHIAAAVAINGVEGDYLMHKERKFIICDPTYLGADIGKCMPDYKNSEVSILDL